MNKPENSGLAAIGWLLALAGAVAVGTFAFSIFTNSYRRSRAFSLLSGDAGVDGIGVENWLLLASPFLVVGLGVALIVTTRSPVPR